MYKKILLLAFLFTSFVSYGQTPAIEWSKCLGGSERDVIYSIVPTPDGGSLLGGNSMSTNGDITCQHDTLGWWDFWLAKLASA